MGGGPLSKHFPGAKLLPLTRTYMLAWGGELGECVCVHVGTVSWELFAVSVNVHWQIHAYNTRALRHNKRVQVRPDDEICPAHIRAHMFDIDTHTYATPGLGEVVAHPPRMNMHAHTYTKLCLRSIRAGAMSKPRAGMAEYYWPCT